MSTCGVLFCARGVARSLHTGLSHSAFSKGETPPTASPHTTDSPPPRPLCATSQDPQLLLPTTTQLRQRTGCVNSDRLASRVERSSLCQPDHFGPDERAHTAPATSYLFVASQQGSALSLLYPREPCAQQGGSSRCAQPLVS